MSLDIISYGEASRADRMLKSTKKKLGADMLENHDSSLAFSTLKERVDALTLKVTSRYRLTDELALQNAINILKAHQQLSLIEELDYHNGDSMVFDDLTDLSGIDIATSNLYTHNAVSHSIQLNHNDAVIETINEVVNPVLNKVIYSIGADADIKVFVSRKRQSGSNVWIELNAHEGIYTFKDSDITENDIRFRFEGIAGSKIHFLGWVIA